MTIVTEIITIEFFTTLLKESLHEEVNQTIQASFTQNNTLNNTLLQQGFEKTLARIRNSSQVTIAIKESIASINSMLFPQKTQKNRRIITTQSNMNTSTKNNTNTKQNFMQEKLESNKRVAEQPTHSKKQKIDPISLSKDTFTTLNTHSNINANNAPSDISYSDYSDDERLPEKEKKNRPGQRQRRE